MNIKIATSDKGNHVLIAGIGESTYYGIEGYLKLKEVKADKQLIKEAKIMIDATSRVWIENNVKKSQV